MLSRKLFQSRGIALSPNWLQDFFRRYTFLALVALSVIAGIMFGATVAYQASMTQEAQEVAGLAQYRPNLVTRVLAADGKTVVGEFSLERRLPVNYDQIPDLMKNAIFAIEDDRFYQHIGVDPIRIVMAAFKNVTKSRKVEGASTLTQQLARALFLSPEKTYTRKIKEALIAMQIERYYTKEQILEMYCNQIFLGGGAYGFEAGSQYYFSKSLKDLSLEECALLAGLPKAPSYYSPTRDAKAASERRNVVLFRMREEGYISDDEYNSARQSAINLNINPPQSNNSSIFGYFVEAVRQESEETFGTYQTQTGGMTIYTTIDPAAQREAVRAVRRGLHSYQDRHGKKWRGKLTNVLDQKRANDLNHYSHPDWLGSYVAGEYIYGLIMNVSGAGAEARFGDYRVALTEAQTRWAGGPPSKLLKRGDLAVFKVVKADNEKKLLEIMLDQLPAVDGALVCLESKTGDVKAMVGGYDFATRKFNNATQAERQTGSTFKPFIYAAAIENGFTPDSIVSAEPFVDRITGWSPANYDGSSGGGMMPLRSALQHSINVVAVRLLSVVGVDKGADIVKRLGLPNPMKRVLPSALGATEEPLIDMTSAYSAFSNMGVRVTPHLIKRVTDSEGNVEKEWEPQATKAISPYVASQMQNMMRAAVTGGTAGSIMSNKELAKRQICGKTGTVNDFTDAWFIGYTPTYTTGVWIGYPGLKKSLGNKEAGSVAALPMWIQFMDKFLKDKPNDQFPKGGPPDREVMAKRGEAERALRTAQADEAAAKASDDTADKAKSAAQDDEPAPEPEPPPKEPARKPSPKLEEQDGGGVSRTDPTRPRTARPRPEAEPPAPKKDDKKKRGKNG
ncbi:MAG TPA: PBP1A family penicillin-binding protein [Blastocatellia bacterium]|nr:PBP1A family penicillin-binding protein [Blastocatellia bacterium]